MHQFVVKVSEKAEHAGGAYRVVKQLKLGEISEQGNKLNSIVEGHSGRQLDVHGSNAPIVLL